MCCVVYPFWVCFAMREGWKKHEKTLLLCAELMVSTLGSQAKLHISTLQMG